MHTIHHWIKRAKADGCKTLRRAERARVREADQASAREPAVEAYTRDPGKGHGQVRAEGGTAPKKLSGPLRRTSSGIR